jgi:hypothetical protein
VLAIDPRTGERKWAFKMHDVTDSGILTTAGDLVFTGGREGYFFALDARNGALLWKATVGGQVGAAPISYQVDRSSTRDRRERLSTRCVIRRLKTPSNFATSSAVFRPAIRFVGACRKD